MLDSRAANGFPSLRIVAKFELLSFSWTLHSSLASHLSLRIRARAGAIRSPKGGRKPPHDEAAVPFDWLLFKLHVDPGGADRQINALRGRVDDYEHTVLILHGDARATAGKGEIRGGRGVIT